MDWLHTLTRDECLELVIRNREIMPWIRASFSHFPLLTQPYFLMYIFHDAVSSLSQDSCPVFKCSQAIFSSSSLCSTKRCHVWSEKDTSRYSNCKLNLKMWTLLSVSLCSIWCLCFQVHFAIGFAHFYPFLIFILGSRYCASVNFPCCKNMQIEETKYEMFLQCWSKRGVHSLTFAENLTKWWY